MAAPTSCGSAAAAGASPSAASSARACGAGSRPSSPSAGRSSSDRPANATSTSDSTPRTRSTVASPAAAGRVLQQRALADPGIPAQHQHAARARTGLDHQPLDALALRLAPQQHGAILRAVRAAVAAIRSRAGGRRRRLAQSLAAELVDDRRAHLRGDRPVRRHLGEGGQDEVEPVRGCPAELLRLTRPPPLRVDVGEAGVELVARPGRPRRSRQPRVAPPRARRPARARGARRR